MRKVLLGNKIMIEMEGWKTPLQVKRLRERTQERKDKKIRRPIKGGSTSNNRKREKKTEKNII